MVATKNIFISIGIITVLLLFIFYLFDVVGIRLIAGLILMILPGIILLNQFSLDIDEEVIISIFLSIVFFPLLVWYTNWIVPSLRITIVLVFFLLLAGAMALRSYFKARNENI